MPCEAANSDVSNDSHGLCRERRSPNDFEIGVEKFAQFPVKTLLIMSPMCRNDDWLPAKLVEMLRP